MPTDIYQAPQAELNDNNRNAGGAEFFVVSIRKLWVMNITTIGMYSIYWHWIHWQTYRKYHDDDEIWPVPRALFSIFFVMSLFDLIEDSYKAKTNEYWNPIYAGALYILLFIFNAVFSFLISDNTPTGALLSMVHIAIYPIIYTAIIAKAQLRANIACDDLVGDTNKKYTTANIIWMVICVICWLSLLVDTYTLMTPPTI